ncbi:type II secretion system F family protein [Limnohabitans sp. Rim8]|uniref:type II secretion system F family protein n=1 Tax=Limnohabitans sp. Rim8 TaxID=1100718 RepID=UPI00263365CA|nr:type II secretion system F family protein [Limnohabitans sp. Rim8]
MTRQWAAMLKAGVPVVQALAMLCRSMSHKNLVRVMQSVLNDVASGIALHDALARHPRHFSGIFVHMVQAGESAGILDEIMERLSQTLEKNEALRSKISSALMYPTAVLTVAMGILGLILVWVVPVFEDVFQSLGAELPWSTRMVVGLSDSLIQAWPVVLFVLAFPIWAARHPGLAAKRVRKWAAQWFLTWPILGPLLTTAIVARWSQTLSALLSAGVPLAEALGSTAQACDHPVFESATLQLQRRVVQGSSLSEAMGQTARFPAMIVQLCATGEETGALDSLLGKAGGLMVTELDDQVNGLTSLLEPLIIVVLGGLIGAILVAMYLPIFNLGQVF